VIDVNLTTPQARLIGQLNPIIKGWTDYYATVSSKAVFSKLAHLTFIKLKRWAKRRHPKKSWGWVYRKYWRRELGTWDFAPKGGISLYRHGETSIKRHVKVRNTKSPYDGDWVY
jgi:RNA-directed DNA polymerase